MSQPAYTFWPWRCLAMATPFTAVLAAVSVLAAETGSNPRETEEQAVLVALTLYGAGTGLLLGAAIGDFGRSLLAMLMGAAMALLAVTCLRFHALWLGPWLVVAAVCASLPLEVSLKGILDALVTGTFAFLYGLFCGGLAFAGALVLSVGVTYSFGRGAAVVALLLGLALAATVAQGAFIGRLFRAAHRVQSAPPAPAAEPNSQTEEHPE